MSGSRLMFPATRNASPLAGKSPGAIRRTIAFLRRLRNAWKRDQGSRMAAALAYYTFLALAPLLVLAVLIAGMLFGEAAARTEIVEWTKEATGVHGAEMVQGILQGPGRPREGIVPLVLGVLVLLVGACRAFQELQKGLSRILAGHETMTGAAKGFLRRLISVGLVLSVGLGLVTIMIGGMALDAARKVLELSSGSFATRILDYLLIPGFGALLLSLLYRFVPGRRAAWKDVWIGAATSAGLFVLARFLVRLYIGHATLASSYGTAGLLVVILIWVHFSAQIVYLGAEVTRLRADSRAS